jgi:hypothetical protein
MSARPRRRADEQGPGCVVRHRPFGPEAVKVAYHLRHAGLTPGNDVIALLEQINRHHPSLTFRDFWGATVLAQALALAPQGSA